MNFKDISEIVTFGAAFLGMGLGLYNFFIERAKRKVKVHVQFKSVMRRFRNSVTGAEGVMTSLNDFNKKILDEYFAIEAVNLSSFPVVIGNVGFEVYGMTERMMIIQPVVEDNGKWPRKLDQRESVTVYGSLRHLLADPNTAKIKNAFVETSCGKICRGTSPALSGLIDYARCHQQGA